MRQGRRLGALLSVLLSAALLLWPAALNGYPLMFGDTGVYVSDGIHLHVSWPRPLFYGLFMRPLHLRLTIWPVIVAQALSAALVLRLVITCFLPGLGAWALLLVTLVLTACTSLPWFVSQVMPDVFGGLMLLALSLLVLAPARLGRLLRPAAVLFAAACITMHQSFLPVALAAIPVLWLAKLRTERRLGWADLLRGAAVPALALAAAIGCNLVLIGQASPSPYGKLFILTRLLLDGPGQRVLQRECPRPDWSLCAFAHDIPATPEAIQFGEDSLLSRAGGYRAVATQAWPVILAALRAEPEAVLRDGVRGAVEQMAAFRTGDELIVPMSSVLQTWQAEFPNAELARLQASRQFRLLPLVPQALQALHVGVGAVLQGVLLIGTIVAWRQRQALAGLYAAALVALVVNAVIAGALSGVYDRYQSRFVWLATFAGLLMLLAWWRRLFRDRIGAASS